MARHRVKKKILTLVDGKDDCEVKNYLESEEEIVLDTYPGTEVLGKHPNRMIRVPLVSSSDPLQKITVIITLSPFYPHQSPTVAIEAGEDFCDEILSKKSGTPELMTTLGETIKLCVDTGVGCVMEIIRILVDALNSDRITPTVISPHEVKVSPQREQPVECVQASPLLTPIPMKEKDAQKLSILTCHLLRKCCFLKYPDSTEEGEIIFTKLLAYFMESNHIIPYQEKLAPWRHDYVLNAFSAAIDLANEEVTNHQAFLKWIWEDPSASTTLTHASGGRYAEQFTEQHKLGSGGFASVFVSRKNLDGRLYAVKKIVMHKRRTRTVLREVKTLANLNHKNIVRYYDAWVEDGFSEDLKEFVESDEEMEDEDEESKEEFSTSEEDSSSDSYESSTASTDMKNTSSSSSSLSSTLNSNYQTLYIQMELCSSLTLRDLLNGDGTGNSVFRSPEGVEIASAILRQLLSVISYTHQNGIIHRDLKPENILFESSENVSGDITDCNIRVVDFGLARKVPLKRGGETAAKSESFIGEETGEKYQAHSESPTNPMSTCCGTVVYSAPEQNQGSQYSLQADEFSIGMIALEMWLAIADKDNDFRKRSQIMTDIWKHENATLPSWFVSNNKAVALIIQGLVTHNVSQRKTCDEVLQDPLLPGRPFAIIEALNTIDYYGNTIAPSVLQHLLSLDYHYRGLSEEYIRFQQKNDSFPWTSLVSMSEWVARLHGFSPIPFMKTHIPISRSMGNSTQERVIDCQGMSYFYSDFPHYAIASYLSCQESDVPRAIFNFYCKKRPYINFSSCEFTEEHREIKCETLCCFLHLLCTTKATGKVTINISHTNWMHAISAARATKPCTFSIPSSIDDSTQQTPPNGRETSVVSFSNNQQYSCPMSPASGLYCSNSLGVCSFPTKTYPVECSNNHTSEPNYGSFFQKIMDEMSESASHYSSVVHDDMSDFLKSIVEAVKAFEIYLPKNLEISVVVSPYLRPSKKVIPKDLLFAYGPFIQCEMSSLSTNDTLPVAFGCAVDYTPDVMLSWGKGKKKHRKEEGKVFVLSIDAEYFMDAIGDTPVASTVPVSIQSGVGIVPSYNKWEAEDILKTCAELWMANIRTSLGCLLVPLPNSHCIRTNVSYTFKTPTLYFRKGSHKRDISAKESILTFIQSTAKAFLEKLVVPEEEKKTDAVQKDAKETKKGHKANKKLKKNKEQ